MTLKDELVEIEAGIAALEERKRVLYQRSIESPENEKLCQNNLAEMLGEPEIFKRMMYPVSIHGITFSGQLVGASENAGRLVRVRPCEEALEGKTFLGIYLGDYARMVGCYLNNETGVLTVNTGEHNPTIWIPSLQRIVYGVGCWWSLIKSEEQLRAITDESIDGIWYVQALKALAKGDPRLAPDEKSE